jgi:hypothetical protein
MNEQELREVVGQLEALDSLAMLFRRLWYEKVRAEISDEKTRAYLMVFDDAFPGLNEVLAFVRRAAEPMAFGDAETVRQEFHALTARLLGREPDASADSGGGLDFDDSVFLPEESAHGVARAAGRNGRSAAGASADDAELDRLFNEAPAPSTSSRTAPEAGVRAARPQPAPEPAEDDEEEEEDLSDLLGAVADEEDELEEEPDADGPAVATSDDDDEEPEDEELDLARLLAEDDEEEEDEEDDDEPEADEDDEEVDLASLLADDEDEEEQEPAATTDEEDDDDDLAALLGDDEEADLTGPEISDDEMQALLASADEEEPPPRRKAAAAPPPPPVAKKKAPPPPPSPPPAPAPARRKAPALPDKGKKASRFDDLEDGDQTMSNEEIDKLLG